LGCLPSFADETVAVAVAVAVADHVNVNVNINDGTGRAETRNSETTPRSGASTVWC
jgi:hypothetical protein